jgi:hypothetical protein
MAIIDHPTRKCGYELFDYKPSKVVQCEFCRALCSHSGHDAGEAADQARKVGWQTVRGRMRSDPKQWACSECIKKPDIWT